MLSSASVAALALLATPAIAQTPTPVEPGGDPCQAPADQRDANAECPPAESPAGEAVLEGAQVNTAGDDAIVVVGSRIRRNQFNTADPVQVLTREESTQAGFISTAEILQSTAVTGGTAQINDAFGGFVVDGGPGVNTISLRGLGTTRTLVLMNGRRVAPAGSRGAVGSADLNVLPNAMIDRIEILNTGASSIYGSDAVAGVVNIVTRTDINGLTLEAQHNFPEVGDGGSQRYSAVAGWNTDRLSISGSVEYFNREALAIGDRSFSSCPTGRYGTNGDDFGADDFVDFRTGEVRCFPLENGGVSINTIATGFTGAIFGDDITLAPGVAEMAPEGSHILCNRFRPNTAVTGGTIPGYECVGGNYYNLVGNSLVFAGGISTNIRDTFSPAFLTADMISPAEIYTGYGQASYETDILGNAEVYVNLLLNRRKSSQSGQRQFYIDYLPDSPLLPDELANVPYVGSGIGFRAFTDYGLYENRQTVDFVRLNGGVTGELPHDWRYELFLGKTWSDADYTTDLILSDKLAQSLDVVELADGSFQCVDTTGGCVAAPEFNHALVGGQYRNTPWFDYITAPVTGHTAFRESTVNFTVDGPVFALPGGSASAALGVEYRKASIDDTPAEDSQNGNLYGFTSSTITRGSDSVWEAFGEVELPLIRDQFIHQLTLNGSARYTEYQSYGGDYTYKVGGLLSPIRAITFRGSYGTSYRAPALFEQFLGATSGFLSNATDPCHNLAEETNPLIIERCLAEGLPPDFLQNSSVTVIGLGGAEAGLEAETSKALTYGVVIHPPVDRLGLGSLSLSVDYFDIKVSNGVAQLSASQVLSQCYADPQRTLCDTPLITREAYTGPGTGDLTVVQSFVNIADAKVEGIDFNARWSSQIGNIGELRLSAAATKFIERYERTLPTDDILDVIGLINNPEWTGTFSANLETGRFITHYGVEWVGETDSQEYAEPFGYDPLVYDLKTDDYFLHNASIRYETDRYGLMFGVRNLFDTNPPTISADYTNLIGNAPLYSAYDYRGRTFFMNVRAGF